MSQKWKLRGICATLCAMLLCISIPVQAKEEEQIKISDKEYAVTLNDAFNLFLCNKKPVSGEIGSKVFLTYTVEEVKANTAIQSGFLGTKDHTMAFPYTSAGEGEEPQGRLYVAEETKGSRLYEEGYTYVFRFERTENGFEYQAAKLKGDEATPIVITSSTGAPSVENYNYYGTWIGGMQADNVSATLNHVRCYDENGNDLGIVANTTGAVNLDEANEVFDVHPIINSSYSFSFDKIDTIAISNKYPAKTDVVYMEYEVENITQDDTYQQGVIVSSAPTATYPHADNKGYMQFVMYEKGQTPTPLLQEGAKYFICFQKKDDGFEANVQRTINGKMEMFSFSSLTGAYDPSYTFFSIWLGEGRDYAVSADFKNVKCYDADGNSLGIQLNRTDVPLSHTGELEDYTTSQAVYYCKDTDTLINLQDEKKYTIEAEGVTTEGTYSIQNDTDLYLLTEEGKTLYHYAYLQLEDEDGNVYKRMKNSTVKFVTGEENFELVAEAKNGFRVEEPEKPTKEGNTFKGWYLSDKTAFNFDTVISESITLYAMWEDGDGNVYLAVDAETGGIDTSLIIAIAASAVIAIGSIVGCIIMVRRKKNGSIQKG